jgi:hypothetical protein
VSVEHARVGGTLSDHLHSGQQPFSRANRDWKALVAQKVEPRTAGIGY